MREPTRRHVLLGLLALPLVPGAAAACPSIVVKGVDVGADRMTFTLPGDELSGRWVSWCETREFSVTEQPRG